MATYRCINNGCLFEAEIISNKELIDCPQCNVMLMRKPDQASHKKPVDRLQQLEERIRELETDISRLKCKIESIRNGLKYLNNIM